MQTSGRRMDLCMALLLVLAGFGCIAASAQSVTVRLLNGKNGKPQSKFRVYIVLGDPKLQHVLDLMTDRNGDVRFDSSEEKTFQVRPIGEVACGEQPKGAPYQDFLISEVVSRGVVTVNNCGRFSPEPIRGRLTYMVRSATSLELFRN